VVCLGGCYGIGALYPVARAHRDAGNHVVSILEAHTQWMLYWQERHQAVADEVYLATSDGSAGHRGLAFDLLQTMVETGRQVDQVYAVGCTFMMQSAARLAEDKDLSLKVALNTVMVDGTGMCGGCRCTVDGEPKFACVNGPEFDGRAVDWEVLLKRRRAYRAQEIASLRRYESRGHLLSSRPLPQEPRHE
jgi:ferredoxin--NADP+ reductase